MYPRSIFLAKIRKKKICSILHRRVIIMTPAYMDWKTASHRECNSGENGCMIVCTNLRGLNFKHKV